MHNIDLCLFLLMPRNSLSLWLTLFWHLRGYTCQGTVIIYLEKPYFCFRSILLYEEILQRIQVFETWSFMQKRKARPCLPVFAGCYQLSLPCSAVDCIDQQIIQRVNKEWINFSIKESAWRDVHTELANSLIWQSSAFCIYIR